MDRRFAFLLAISIAGILLLASGCAEKQTIDLTPSYTDVSSPESGIAKQVEEAVSDIGGGAEAAGGNESLSANETKAQREEMPLSIPEDANIYVNPDALVKKLCTIADMGMRRCRNTKDGDLNITIKNPGSDNLTMIFYLLTDSSELGYYYSGEPLNAREEKTYTLDFDKLKETYGPISQIQATPVLVVGLEADACINKKLPIIVSGCG